MDECGAGGRGTSMAYGPDVRQVEIMKLMHWTTAVAAVFLVAAAQGGDAEVSRLSVADLAIRPGATGTVIVSGHIDGALTYGVTIMLELIPQHGAVGTLRFTPADGGTGGPYHVLVEDDADGPGTVRVVAAPPPGTDVAQLGDVWPAVGTFTPLDTGVSGSTAMNGCVDDNGSMLSGAARFSGPLAGFPVLAEPDASGTWDVVLSTPAGDSSWEGVPTVLSAGTVRVTPDACVADDECADEDACTVDTCQAGVCSHAPRTEGCDGEGSRRKKSAYRPPAPTGGR